MNPHITRIIVAVFLTMMLTRTAFSFGVKWEAVTSGGAAEHKEADHFYYMPGKMKMVEGKEGQFVIIRLDQELMIMGDPARKAYYQMTFGEMEQMMEGANAIMDSQMEAMRQQLAALPEEQRKMAEQMMGSQMKPKEPEVEVEKTGETKTVSGYSCTKYVVKEDGATVSSVWASNSIPEFAVMKKDMEEFAKRMAAMSRASSKKKASLTEGVDGFPMLTESVDGSRTEVTNIEAAEVPASEFEVPQGYSREEMPGMPASGVPDGY